MLSDLRMDHAMRLTSMGSWLNAPSLEGGLVTVEGGLLSMTACSVWWEGLELLLLAEVVVGREGGPWRVYTAPL